LHSFGGAETTESELCRVFSAYGNVKSTKIIVDRAGVSKGYGFVTFDTPAVIDSLMVRLCRVFTSRQAGLTASIF
jgi:RNA recognition motif. (a.k.a. RRM, RBD, or RNP domain)